jgi:hypothetical protein
MWFLFEEGRFHNVFDAKPAKCPLQKKKSYQNTHPQLDSYEFARKFGH